MKRGRVIWIAILACCWACWLAVCTVYIWRWMDFHLTTVVAGGMLLPVVLEKVGVKRLLIGNSKDDEQGDVI